MSAWVVIVVDDLKDYLAADQLEALRSAALGDGQVDPFDNIMHDRANYIRNRVSGKVNVSATAYAVPPELKTQACYLIIEAMQVRLSIGLELTKNQVDAIERSYKDLDIAGTDKFPISSADDAQTPDVQPASSGIRVVQHRPRTISGETMRGL